MSEQEIREGMLLAVWDEPPLDFDPDTLIRRVEQKKSRRRALVAVGVATAMIAVVSFSLPGLLPRDRGDQLASEVQPSVSSAAPGELDEVKAQSIGDGLAQKLRETQPGLREIYGDFRVGQYPYPPSSSPRSKKPGDPEVSGYVHLTDDIGPTSLRVEVVKRKVTMGNFCGSAAMVCKEVKQADGTTVIEAEFSDGGPDISRAEVVRVFESGLSVHIAAHYYNPATGSGLRQTVPLRVGVLTTLVTDPAIAWQ